MSFNVRVTAELWTERMKIRLSSPSMRRREQEDYACLSVTVYHAKREAYITNCNLEETELQRRIPDRKKYGTSSEL